jgi:ketosteroid isomerase-like protein
MSRTSESSATDTHDSEPLATARRALEAFSHGYRTAEWDPFLALLAPDVEFWLPVGPYEERNVGRDALAGFLRTMTDEHGARFNIHPPIRTSHGDGTVVFECPEDGDIGGSPVTNRLAVSFDVRDGLVHGMREYLGMTSGLVAAAVAQERSA